MESLYLPLTFLSTLLKSPVRTIMACALCTVTTTRLNAQANAAAQPIPAKPLTYEVVSIRQSKPNSTSAGYNNLPDGFSMTNLPLKALIPDAYGFIRDDQVSGWPGWTDYTRFDINAKMDAETADALQKLPKQQREAQRRLMMQSFLADRFKLKVHRGTEVRTTYELVPARGGLKMKEDNRDTDLNGVKLQEGVRPAVDWMASEGSITGHAMPVSILASHLQGAVDALVVDKTGLTARYDVDLKWDPKNGQDPKSTQPSIFTALPEQLGLQLKPIRTTVETIIIDHLGMPSEN